MDIQCSLISLMRPSLKTSTKYSSVTLLQQKVNFFIFFRPTQLPPPIPPHPTHPPVVSFKSFYLHIHSRSWCSWRLHHVNDYKHPSDPLYSLLHRLPCPISLLYTTPNPTPAPHQVKKEPCRVFLSAYPSSHTQLRSRQNENPLA